jgi:predicted transposase/invertase (TIGR01784 family)
VRTKYWDHCLKLLIHANPQAFVSWLVAGAVFVKERHEKPHGCDLEMDSLLEATLDGEALLIQIEFQSRNDSEMPERLLRYNVLARIEHQLPVHSYVIYLLSDGEIKPSPLKWATPIKSDVVQFQFENIEVTKLPPENIIQTGSIGLLPLLPLTRSGATREIVEKMLVQLQQPEHNELAVIGYTLAALIFKRTSLADLDWLERNFREMDNLMHESPIYQMILEEGEIKGYAKGLVEGIAKGREEGIEEGIALGLGQAIVNLVQAHFPELKGLAAQQVAPIKNVALLNHLLFKISSTSDAKEARSLLLNPPEEKPQEQE